ncbi:unnamed protein product [Haemonchus placei]|uniref:G_PROTEIN_RECEP_F1_2 domain-containing protein n=1 Tax=Haemonchus placei TaxID=6290 RepID=A0A0N4X5A8_HAEPC|nr:unnamed protein product [Haemonchus placei]
MLLLSNILHSLTEGLGLATNALLIYLVLTKTPKRLTTYSILILNFAICDLLTCMSAFFVQQRYSYICLFIYYSTIRKRALGVKTFQTQKLSIKQ